MDNIIAGIAQEGHGAIQVEEAGRSKLIVTIVGPICFWWQPGQWDSPDHVTYREWREALRVALVKSQECLVFAPWRAIQGSWDERAQAINDAGIKISDVVIDITPPGVPASGTQREVALANASGVKVISAPPGDHQSLKALVEGLGLKFNS